MKKIAIILTAVLLVGFCYATAQAVVTTDRTVSVAASGSITGTTSLSVAPISITYGNTGADSYPTVPANNKIVISYSSNYNPWKMMVYTNNTQVTNYDPVSKKGRYVKAGLVAGTGDAAQVVPCKWVAKIGSNTIAPTLPTASTYNFVKDKNDTDDPSTVTDPTTGKPVKEDWASAFADGYTNIAFGGPGGGYCVNPTNDTPGDTQYRGDAISGSIALYVAAGWGTSFYATPTPAGAGSYTTNFVVELYHE